MKSIQISNELYRRYKNLGEELVDTHETLMDKLISLGEMHNRSLSQQTKVGKTNSASKLEFSFSELPVVTHTRIDRWTLDGKEYSDASWNGIIRDLLCFLDRQKTDILNQSSINIKNGKDCSKGYKYIPEIGVSYQGLSAEDALRAIKEFSEKYELDITIHITWNNVPNAQHPGKEGIISTEYS